MLQAMKKLDFLQINFIYRRASETSCEPSKGQASSNSGFGVSFSSGQKAQGENTQPALLSEVHHAEQC